MNYYIFITALSVSLDSFFGGLSVIHNGKFAKKVGQIISVVLVMCLITNYFGRLLKPLFKSNTDLFGGLCLICIAIYQLFSKKKNTQNPYLLGFAVGLDGACANFSLAIMGYNNLLVPITLTFFHLVFLCLGYAVTRIGKMKNLSENKFLSPIILTGLGFYKIILSTL